MRLKLSRFVEGDLEAIADFIAHDNPERAVSFIRQIRHQILEIGKQPLLYQLRPEIGEGARLAVLGRYVVLFRVVAGTVRPAVARTVRIERVVYGGRDLPQLLDNPEPANQNERDSRVPRQTLPASRRAPSTPRVALLLPNPAIYP